jgi:parallel beta-helix repeat protein
MRQWHGSRPSYASVGATRLSLAAILVLALAGLVAFSSASAARSRGSRSQRRADAAAPVHCGDTITADTTLHHNLVNCPNNGILIGADNVTLDLNYHTIDGDGTPAAGCDPDTEFCDGGVISDGHDAVTVVHGAVREFDIGVFVGRASHSRVLGISSSTNRFTGLGFFRDTRSLIRNSSGSGSGAPAEEDSAGMFLVQSHHVRVRGSSVRNNGNRGIIVIDSTDNLIKGNRTSRNRAGIILDGSDRNQVRRNRSVRDGDGIVLRVELATDENSNRNVIARNRIAHVIQRQGTDGQGIEVTPPGNRNVIARNSVRDTDNRGIDVGSPHKPSVGTVVRRNHIRGTGKAGLHVNPGAKHTLLRRNRASHSGDDGFDVEGRTTKLTKNRAVRNADLGIEAVRGVIDGGGNKASHNGDPRQCINIVCR